jgi:ribosomal protein S14
MASKLTNKQNFNIRYNIYKKLENKFINKLMIKDVYIPHGIYNNNNKKKYSNSIIHSKCLISGRSKANINKFKMSRMIFKKYSEFGFLNGIRKSSW